MVQQSLSNAGEKTARPPSQVFVYADRAQVMLRSLGLEPNPKNYNIFFACAAGQPTELVREIELAIAKKTQFSEDYLDSLYTNYIVESHSRAVQETARSAKEIIAEMLSNLAVFSDDTKAITKDVAGQLEKLDAEASEEVVRLFANTLMESAKMMLTSSDSISTSLAGAQQEILELRETLARVMTESERDFLTGTYNRKAFDKHMGEALEEAREKHTDLTLLMIDIDHFKQFNDTYGHLIGDEVLKTVAKTLSDLLKGTDCVARYGGEEFAVILPRTPLKGGMIVGEELRRSIARRELKRKSNGETFGAITVSIGVASLRHQEDTALSLIQRADKAMYHSKNNGRNRVTEEDPAA
jgi:diguanylate cyclase